MTVMLLKIQTKDFSYIPLRKAKDKERKNNLLQRKQKQCFPQLFD